MRIMQVIHSLRRGGAERVVVDLATGLARRGHEVRICTVVPVHDLLRDLEEGERSSLCCESILQSSRSRYLLSLPLLVARLHQKVRQFQPDVLHCHLETDAAVCSFVRTVPILRTIHITKLLTPLRDFPLRSYPLMWLEKRSWLNSHMHLATCSHAAARSLSAYLAERGRPAPSVVLNGIDLRRFRNVERHRETTGSCKIVMVGTLLNSHKNQQMALRALRELLNKQLDCSLWLLGDGSDRASLQDLALRLDIGDRVKFFGVVSNVPDYLSRASMCWVTSRFEGLPIAMLEAMAAGLPVIATAVPGVEEVLSAWPELLVPLDDYRALADVTANMIRSAHRMEQVGATLRAYVLRDFSGSRMVEDYLNLYRRMIRRTS